MASIVWLKVIDKDDIDVAGGKGANLAELYNIGLPVPPAFIVTAQAYKQFLIQEKLSDKINAILSTIDIENTVELENKAREIQKIIIEAEMPYALEKEILEAYDGLNISEELTREAMVDVTKLIKAGKEPAFVAVRSSATTEDLSTASFAGQQETFLNVRSNEELIEAIKHCWASLFTARAIYYRERKGFEHSKSFIAVIVQRMVNADKAGVIFTVNPSTNKEEIVIEACFGLGEGVVSGATAPDYYVVDKSNLKLIEKKISRKSIYFTRDSAGKTKKSELPFEKINQQVLTESEIKELANYAIKIEKHYKTAQDIEFAIEAANVYVLQTRPVTTLGKEAKAFAVSISGKVLIEGLPASPGIASGVVKIIHSLDELSKIKKGDVLVTKMTNPDMVVTMQKSVAVVTDEGGMTAHAAIVSREMGLPCIVGTMKATSVLKESQVVTVNGTNGKVYEGKVGVPEEVSKLETKGKEEALFALAVPQVRPVKIYMNLGQPEKIIQYKNLQFDGIGLMRIEFVIASQIGEHPLYLIETKQQDKYINKLAGGIALVAKTIAPRPVVVRFSDLKSNEYKSLKGGEKYEIEEANPMIGFRGVSRYTTEKFKEAFKLECKAIRKVCETYKNVWVMLPFVRTPEEVLRCLEIMRQEGLVRSKTFKIWLMAEVPSIAITAEEFAKLPIDGVSIGSNDLTQLVLGVDRDSALLAKLGYFDERNYAVLKAIALIIRAFKKHNKTVSICGQAPSVYPQIVKFLVRQNIDSISVNPDVVNSVRANVIRIQKEVREEKEKEKKEKTIEEEIAILEDMEERIEHAGIEPLEEEDINQLGKERAWNIEDEEEIKAEEKRRKEQEKAKFSKFGESILNSLF